VIDLRALLFGDARPALQNDTTDAPKIRIVTRANTGMLSRSLFAMYAPTTFASSVALVILLTRIEA
jgi:hypothetical protein